MGLRETAVIYFLLGLVVAAAVVLRQDESSALRRAGMGVAAALFWPLFAPLVLAARPAPVRLETRIRIAEGQLVEALSRIDGVAQGVVAPELARVKGLAGSMAAMEARIREMDALLATREFDGAAAQAALGALEARGVPEADPRVGSVRSRLRNIERLRAMRDRTSDDLERIVLKLEEMTSQLGLLKFAGKSDADLVRMIKDIADSIEEVTDGLLQAT